MPHKDPMKRKLWQRKYQMAWYYRNREKLLQKRREYYWQNREKELERRHKYYRECKDVILLKDRLRKARKRAERKAEKMIPILDQKVINHE